MRSFQATVMAALFLGQLWNFPLRSRAVLLGAGVVFAFFCNVVRALLLSFVAEKHGIAAVGKWHDPAGFTILGICFAGLLGLALWLRPKGGRGLAAPEMRGPQSLPRVFVVAMAAWVAFFCVWEDRKEPGAAPSAPETWTPASRWRAVLQRKRRFGQQTLEIAISGIENEKDARAEFERRVTAFLRPDSILPADVAVPDPTATTAR